jgi:hypothetical protein
MSCGKQYANSDEAIFIDQYWRMVFKPIGDPPTKFLLPGATGVEPMDGDQPRDAAAEFPNAPIDGDLDRIIAFLPEISFAVRTMPVGHCISVESSIATRIGTAPCINALYESCSGGTL